MSFFKIIVNHQEKGLDSLLLETVIDYCKSECIEFIEGEAVDDSEFLESWYKRRGFSVDSNN